MITLTYDQLDELTEKVKKADTQAEPVFPTMEELKRYVCGDFRKYFLYILWLMEEGKAETEEEKKVRKELYRVFEENVEFIDPEEDSNDSSTEDSLADRKDGEAYVSETS